MVLEELNISPLRVALYLGIAVIAWLIAMAIREGISKWYSKKCRRGHKKKYVRLESWSDIDCKEHGHHLSNTPHTWWSIWGVWICGEPGCNSTGKDCFGTKAFWKIHMGEVVIDEKAMSDPEEARKGRVGPKESADRDLAARQGLPKAVCMDEAVQLLTDLAILAKKGQIKVKEAGENTQEPGPPPPAPPKQ